MKSIFGMILLFTSMKALALTNSQPALSDELQSHVWISTEARDPSDNSSVPAYCNATMVHPRLLVTAAHCVRDAFFIHDFKVNVEVGKYKYVTRPDGTTARVGYARYLKEQKGAQFIFTRALTSKIQSQGLRAQIGPQEDLALIVLDSVMNLPAGVTVMTAISQAELRGILGSLATYKPTVVTINLFAESSTDTKRFAELNQLKWNSAGYFESRSTSRVEDGDSGSALVIKTGNTWKLIGVVKGRAQAAFNNWDVFTALDQKACELGQQIGVPELQAAICK